MTVDLLQRRALPSRLAVLCLPVAVSLVLPSAAMAAAAGGSTVRAVVGGDGSVKSVKLYSSNGSASGFTGSLPLKLSIGRSVSGNQSTYTYDVENTFTKTQDVSYTDTQGKVHTVSQTLQLPLVAQLGIQLPKSFKDVTTPNGVVLTDPDGTNRVLYDLVLFSPLGSPKQSVTFTATGKGVPTAELAARTVDPATTAGLSSAAQDANANSQQDDFWQGFSGGGNDGLTKLVAGMSQIVAGMAKLHDGLGPAVTGAQQLDTGTASADKGAHDLSNGLGQIHTGLQSLTGGLTQIHGGQSSLTSGLSQIHGGQQQLSGGLTTIHDGQGTLSAGLDQISGGLGQLADAQTGLPAAAAGIAQLSAGVKAMLAGVGDDTTTNTVLFGLNAIKLGAQQISAGFTSPTGLLANLNLAHVQLGIAATAAAGNVSALTAIGFADTVVQGVAGAIQTQVLGGINQIYAGAIQLHDGISHPASATDPGGIKEGLQAIDAGLTTLQSGVAAAAAGVTALSTGATAASAGAKQLTAGSSDALAGSNKLASGSGDALAGAQKLTVGTASALAGAQQLTAGSGSAVGGGEKLAAGLDQLAAGQHQVAAGLPTAVNGVGQLLTGASAVKDGLGQVQTGAVTPLNAQLVQGSQNAKKQIAILNAAAALASEAPGGAGTSYVLTQSPGGFRLASTTSTAKAGGTSHTGRNIGIGLGGLAVLVIAVTAGFALGRRATVSA